MPPRCSADPTESTRLRSLPPSCACPSSSSSILFFSSAPATSTSTPFPYTTLFRSKLRIPPGSSDEATAAGAIEDLASGPPGGARQREPRPLGAVAPQWPGLPLTRGTRVRLEEYTHQLQSR